MEEKINIRLIEWGTKEYEKELELRHNVFRVPSGLNIYDEDLSHEIHDYHVCAFLNDRVVGALIISKSDNDTAHIKQVAVDAEIRGKNIGRKIMEFAEEVSETMGCTKITLNARITATEFYKKLGYISIGEEFLDPRMTVGMVYIKMEKELL